MNNTTNIQLTTRSVRETEDVGRSIATVLQQGDLIALVGPLGAGKTQFTRGLAAGLGANPRLVASPTFVLVQEYAARIPLVHIDAYRINSLADLESIGFTPELLAQSVTVIEWADRIEEELPADRLEIELEHDQDSRRIVIVPHGKWVEALQLLRNSVAQPQRKCSTCGKPANLHSAWFPFCSERCRLLDLNRWFKGDYSLSRPITEEDHKEA